MAKRLISGYLLYRYICEQCEMETEWFKRDLSLDVGSGTNGFLSERRGKDTRYESHSDKTRRHGDMQIQSEKLLLGMAAVIKHNVLRGDYSDFPAGAKCSNCKSCQSWFNTESVGSVLSSVVATMVISLLVCTVLGGLITSMGVTSALIVSFIIGLVFGVLLSLLKVILPFYTAKKLSQETAERTVKNLPEIDWNVYKNE